MYLELWVLLLKSWYEGNASQVVFFRQESPHLHDPNSIQYYCTVWLFRHANNVLCNQAQEQQTNMYSVETNHSHFSSTLIKAKDETP